MRQAIDDSVVNILFREARTYSKWQPQSVDEQTLRDLYDILKWAPTSANTAPARFAFLRSKEAKERLRPALAPGNVEKTMTAPVTVIVGYDMKFYEQVPKLFPQSAGPRDLIGSEKGAQSPERGLPSQNSSLTESGWPDRLHAVAAFGSGLIPKNGS